MKYTRCYILLLTPLVILSGVACQRGETQAKAEIESAIREHLATRTDLAMDKMQMEVKQVNFSGDTAEAEVSFSAKGGEGGEMIYRYTLARENGRWAVKRGTSGGALPPGHPPTGGSETPPESPPRND